jgi:hypothetical protein
MACFITKQVGLELPNFASKPMEERWRVVHVASSQRSRRGEAKYDRFDGIGCGAVEVRPKYHLFDVIFLVAQWGILVFCFHYK